MSAQSDIQKYKGFLEINQKSLVSIREKIEVHSGRTSDCDEQFRSFIQYGTELSNLERDALYWIGEYNRLITFNEQWIKNHPHPSRRMFL